jgi:hypothetical protein
MTMVLVELKVSECCLGAIVRTKEERLGMQREEEGWRDRETCGA